MKMNNSVEKKSLILAPSKIEANNICYAKFFAASEHEATVDIDSVWIYEQAMSYRSYCVNKTVDDFIKEMTDSVSDPIFVKWESESSKEDFQAALKEIWEMTAQ